MGVQEGRPSLIALSDYRAPAAPAHHAFERLQGRVRRLLQRKPAEAVQDDRLRRADNAALHGAADDPDLDGLLELLCDAFHEHDHDNLDELGDDVGARVRVLVIPPCEPVDLIARLAARHALATLDPPSRRTLLEKPDDAIRVPAGEGGIVVPRLQNWFLRHPDGLAHCRALLNQVAASERRWLIGVDAWSWRYLVRAAAADLLLPAPRVWPAFDADRLADWLGSQIDARTGGEDGGQESGQESGQGGRTVRIRTLKGNEDVFARDEQGALRNDYLRNLAARSRGIPWVAWHLWRHGLRAVPEPEEEGDDVAEAEASEKGAAASEDGVTTLWVTQEADQLLPGGHETHAMMVLQALLVHAGLRRVDLQLVLPITLELEALLRALHRAGFVDCHPDTQRWSVSPRAYPAVRTALDEAGWSMAAL